MATSTELPSPTAGSAPKERIASQLDATRKRTLALVDQLSEEALNAVHDPLMSPIVWDLGHIANFEELWLVRRVGGRAPLHEELGGVYDPFAAPRRERGELPYLRSADCLAYMEAVRGLALDCLEKADLSADAGRLLAGGFVYELILRHEQQHCETILQTLQLMTREAYEPRGAMPRPRAEPGSKSSERMVLVPGGRFEMGATDERFAYDNERPVHQRGVGPFWIDVAPVTNGEWAEWVEAGGYDRREWWSDAGWQWRRRRADRGPVELPRYWQREGSGFAERSFARVDPIDPRRPVCHVSWFEADAFARSQGKRLPTEAEWEKAASWDAPSAVKSLRPWGDGGFEGRANLDQLTFGTSEVGAYPAGASAAGVLQMMGDVWEWTASGFERYDGFAPFPYREYSESFFGGPFKVLRGGSWATRADAVTTTFRNWDYPERRQIFAGLRCARDAGEGEE